MTREEMKREIATMTERELKSLANISRMGLRCITSAEDRQTNELLLALATELLAERT